MRSPACNPAIARAGNAAPVNTVYNRLPAATPDDGGDVDTLFQIADAALYGAKNAKDARQADDGKWLKRA